MIPVTTEEDRLANSHTRRQTNTAVADYLYSVFPLSSTRATVPMRYDARRDLFLHKEEGGNAA